MSRFTDEEITKLHERYMKLKERNIIMGTALTEIVQLCSVYALTDSYEVTKVAKAALEKKPKERN